MASLSILYLFFCLVLAQSRDLPTDQPPVESQDTCDLQTDQLPVDDLPFEDTNPPFTEDGHPLYEGDILLTHTQRMEIEQRKFLTLEASLWPKGPDDVTTIPYRFGDEEVHQRIVLDGIANWEKHTCIRFEETNSSAQHHLVFIKGKGCYSYLGRVPGLYSGQKISIGENCLSLGTVVHEIGHAIGFLHEQCRPDRDKYIRLNTENIADSRIDNFKMYPENEVSTKVPYDFMSVMHYYGKAFSKNGKLTIATVDPLMQELIGRRHGLSHRDKLTANLRYGCLDKWLNECGEPREKCLNEGYTGSDCKCVCRPGTSGLSCETVDQDYNAVHQSECTETITKPGRINSPDNTKGLICTKLISAPSDQFPMITFNKFHMEDCEKKSDFLEIRRVRQINGKYYCGKDITRGTTFVSSTNEFVLIFYTTQRASWSFDITFQKRDTENIYCCITVE